MNQFHVKEMFKNILENPNFDEGIVEKYFTADYQQEVDNTILNRIQFIQHIKKLKTKVKSLAIEILNIMENENTVFTKHLAKTTLKDGRCLCLKIFAEFTFEQGRIKHCDELTILINGDQAEKGLGSEI